jgi:hypothetical protein
MMMLIMMGVMFVGFFPDDKTSERKQKQEKTFRTLK